MYKEPFASRETNAAAALRVKQKMEQVAVKVADQDQSDADFMANLLDLCTLNRMAESHQPNATHDGRRIRRTVDGIVGQED